MSQVTHLGYSVFANIIGGRDWLVALLLASSILWATELAKLVVRLTRARAKPAPASAAA